MSDADLLAAFGWRDGVLLLAAGVGVYLVLTVIRLFKASTPRKAQPDPAPDFPAWQPDFLIDAAQAPEAEPAAAAPAAPAADFAGELARSNLEVECRALRRECGDLRDAVARLEEEIAGLKATRGTSPLYQEAMTLARQGLPAAGIAGRCGISVAEAELVAALARGDAEFEVNDEGEERDGTDIDPGNQLHR